MDGKVSILNMPTRKKKSSPQSEKVKRTLKREYEDKEEEEEEHVSEEERVSEEGNLERKRKQTKRKRVIDEEKEEGKHKLNRKKKDEFEQTKREFEQTKRKLDQKKDELDQKKDEFDQTKRKLDQRKRKLVQKKDKLDEKQDELDEENDALNQTKQKLLQRKDEFQQKNQMLLQRKHRVEYDLRTSKQEYGQVEMVIGNELELVEVTKELTNVTEELAKMDAELLEVNSKLVEMESRLVKMNSKLAELKQELDKLEQEIAEVKYEIAKVEYEIAEVKYEIAKVEDSPGLDKTFEMLETSRKFVLDQYKNLKKVRNIEDDEKRKSLKFQSIGNLSVSEAAKGDEFYFQVLEPYVHWRSRIWSSKFRRCQIQSNDKYLKHAETIIYSLHSYRSNPVNQLANDEVAFTSVLTALLQNFLFDLGLNELFLLHNTSLLINKKKNMKPDVILRKLSQFPLLLGAGKLQDLDLALRQAGIYANECCKNYNKSSQMLLLGVTEGEISLLMSLFDSNTLFGVEIAKVELSCMDDLARWLFVFDVAVRELMEEDISKRCSVFRAPLFLPTWDPEIVEPMCVSSDEKLKHESRIVRVGEKVFKIFSPASLPNLYPPPNLDVLINIGNTYLNPILHALDEDFSLLEYDFVDGSHNPTFVKQFTVVAETLAKAHSKNLIHGDIRLLNIIFKDETAYLIDWDLSGPKGEKRYPLGYKATLEDVDRHRDAKPDFLLRPEHDWFSFGSILKRFIVDQKQFMKDWMAIIKLSQTTPVDARKIIEQLKAIPRSTTLKLL